MRRKLCELLEKLATLEKKEPTKEVLRRKFEILSRIAFIQLLMSGPGVSALNSLVESCEQLDREASELFSMHRPQKVREVYVPEIDRYVRYIPLTPEENRECLKIDNVMDRIMERVYFMLSKSDPNITREKLRRIDFFGVIHPILKAILEHEHVQT